MQFAEPAQPEKLVSEEIEITEDVLEMKPQAE